MRGSFGFAGAEGRGRERWLASTKFESCGQELGLSQRNSRRGGTRQRREPVFHDRSNFHRRRETETQFLKFPSHSRLFLSFSFRFTNRREREIFSPRRAIFFFCRPRLVRSFRRPRPRGRLNSSDVLIKSYDSLFCLELNVTPENGFELVRKWKANLICCSLPVVEIIAPQGTRGRIVSGPFLLRSHSFNVAIDCKVEWRYILLIYYV